MNEWEGLLIDFCTKKVRHNTIFEHSFFNTRLSNLNQCNKLCIVLSKVFFSMVVICPYWLAKGDNWDFPAPLCKTFDFGEGAMSFGWDQTVASSLFLFFLWRKSVGLELWFLPDLKHKLKVFSSYFTDRP